jgi:CBS domain-containing protein
MIARDVMTRDVVSVTSDTPVRKIASLLVKNRISAVPVADSSGGASPLVSGICRKSR